MKEFKNQVTVVTQILVSIIILSLLASGVVWTFKLLIGSLKVAN